ncbi:MAG TPA: hypothetical protein VKC54_00425 [Patescibacteria group bacterium]|nr:hypothetical protein [Patescibacteria group bacterium]
MTENPCRDLGCPAACCRNIVGHMPVSETFFLKAFPNAVRIDSTSEEYLRQKVKDREHGVYYFNERGWTYFAVSGSCPNLSEDFNCRIHGETFYPKACINMIVKSVPCLDSQEIYKANLIWKG